jgi:hypothetical protein
MCCATLVAQYPTMATTQLTHARRCDVCWPSREQTERHQKLLRMSWVVVTDENGNRQLRMCWVRT